MFEKMRAMLAEQLCLDEASITMDSSFKDDLDADSLDLYELVMAFEDEYDIEIPTDELESIQTVGDLVEYLQSKGIE